MKGKEKKKLYKRLWKQETQRRIETVEVPALLRSARILGEALESWGGLLLLELR